MGFMFKKQMAASSSQARRDRARYEQDRRDQHHHPATVNPPSNYGAQNPTPMPASVYQANGMRQAPVQAASYNASSYGAFPGNSAPVQATVYVPGQGAVAATTSGPVVATAYVPGGASAAQVAHTTTPVQASAYHRGRPLCAPSHNLVLTEPAPEPAPPSLNPNYESQQSINNGNSSYNTDESSFWECSVCTFPNMRTESTCKGCASPIPPGMLYSAAAASAAPPPPQDTTTYSHPMTGNMHQMNAQMNNISMGGAAKTGASAAAGGSYGVMRVHIPNGMQTGQKIKVRSPDGKEVVKTIPPQSEWQYDGTRPFFRMQFGSSPAAPATYANASYETRTPTTEVPPLHTTSWREFHPYAPSRYTPPPLAVRSVPHSPRGGAGLPPNGRHKSLIIGINYTGSRAALRGCINDAKNMQVLLQRNGFPNDGSHMLLLTDERNRGNEYQPTVQMITKAFAWFMKDVRRGDVLFFHFSGHGGQQPDKTGMEVDGYNETIIPVDYERKGQITDDILWGSLVYNLPEGARITALMDMCHSGTGLDLPYDYNVNTRRWTEDVNPAHSAGDVVLFSGCEDSQTSADVGGGKMAGGAMTQAFMGAYETTGMATYHEFLTAVKKQLRKKRFSQRPQLTSSQQFDANSRIFSLGYQSSLGGVPSVIEPNHNPKVGRQKRRHVRAARQGFGGGGGNNLFGMLGAAVGAALVADALF
mmetsp:Transcript_233/g.398  ORF Transcript_233/g.398 Transcript_233/m.398 type:complete len:702 (+) Transcript_233:142-2247(+)